MSVIAVNVLDEYRGVPALETWNAPLGGYVASAATQPVGRTSS